MSKGKKGKSDKEKVEKTNQDTQCLIIDGENKSLDCCNNLETELLSKTDLNNELIYDVSDFFKVFGDATRIRILHLLMIGEMCVGDIADKLEMTQSAVSHQLRVLRQSDLVKYHKDGKTVFYSLDDDHVKTVLEQGISHIRHKKEYN